MLSRILPRDQSGDAAPHEWRQAAGTAVQRALAPPGETEKPPPGEEEYRALEAQLRQIEQQIPQREQQSRQTGYREGEAAATARWEAAIERATRSVSEMASLRPRLRREAEGDVVRLSIAVARRIVRRELSIDAEALLGMVKAALERIEMREAHRVRVRPEDTALVGAYLERIGSPQRIEVVPDTTLDRGGVILETTRGNVDASLETQLAEIERGFADRLGAGA